MLEWTQEKDDTIVYMRDINRDWNEIRARVDMPKEAIIERYYYIKRKQKHLKLAVNQPPKKYINYAVGEHRGRD